MSTFDLGLILHIFTSPNSAFAQIRDNEEKYFAQSMALLVLSSALGTLAVLPFVMMPLDESYLEIGSTNNIDNSFPMHESDLVMYFGLSLLNGFVSATLYYFIGKKLDGNANWKKVFSVFFHTHAIAIPMMIITTILIFLMWGSFTSIDPSNLMNPDLRDEEAFSLLGPFLAYVVLLVIFGLGFFIWILIVTIKAIKTVHGFSTGKALGLIILVIIITSMVSIPFSL